MAKEQTTITQGATWPFAKIIARDDDNARTTYEGIDELAIDIKQGGLLQPLGVRLVTDPKLSEEEREQLGLKADEKPGVVAFVAYGFRRYYAIDAIRDEDKKAFVECPVVEIKGNALDARFANFNENLGRHDVRPPEMAQALYDLNVNQKVDIKTIAKRIPGKSKGYLQSLITLRKRLSEDSWRAFEEGKITYDVARVVQKAGGEEEQAAALKAALKAAAAQEGKGKKQGVAKAAAEAGGGVVRPGQKDQKGMLEGLQELEKPSNYQLGIIAGLRWATGDIKNLAKKQKK